MSKKKHYSTTSFLVLAIICVFLFDPIFSEAKTYDEKIGSATSSLPIGVGDEVKMLLGVGETETTSATSISLLLDADVYPVYFLLIIITFITGILVVLWI